MPNFTFPCKRCGRGVSYNKCHLGTVLTPEGTLEIGFEVFCEDEERCRKRYSKSERFWYATISGLLRGKLAVDPRTFPNQDR